MPTISTSQARAEFTSMCVDVFRTQLPAFNFLRSGFKTVQEYVKYLSIQVEKNSEPTAVDVLRGTEGNRNNFSITREKVFEPPYYSEVIELTDIDLYDRLFGSTAIDEGIYSQLIATVAMRMGQLRDKIERSYEKQVAEIYMLGTTTFSQATSINWGRAAGSLVANGAGNTWATGTVDPFETIAAGCQYVRQQGKSGDYIMDCYMGQTAASNLMNNTIFKERVFQNLNNNIDVLAPASRNAAGANWIGQLTCGAYKVNLWTYPQSYDVIGGTALAPTITPTPYLDDKKIVITPTNKHFKLGFAAVPQVLVESGASNGNLPSLAPLQAQPYVVDQYVDQMNSSHKMRIKSAGLAIPTAVDQMYTVQVVA